MALQIPICVPQNDTERVRVGTITDHARHDLAVGPADKFQFVSVRTKADNHVSPLYHSLWNTGLRPSKVQT